MSKRRPLTDFCRKHKMNRYRILNMHTGERVEVSANSIEGACSSVGWSKVHCYWSDLGKKPILPEPKWYVRPSPERKGGDIDE